MDKGRRRRYGAAPNFIFSLQRSWLSGDGKGRNFNRGQGGGNPVFVPLTFTTSIYSQKSLYTVSSYCPAAIIKMKEALI